MKGFYPKRPTASSHSPLGSIRTRLMVRLPAGRPVKSFLDMAVVYLEQYRDICNTGIEIEFFEEEIKGLAQLRQKTLYLQRSWKKFITQKP